MGCVDPYKLGQDEIELEAEPFYAFTEDPVGGLCFFVSVGPGVDEASDGFPTSGVSDRDFVEIGIRFAADAKDTNTICAGILYLDRGEISNDSGCDVLVRVAHLIEQLLF